MPTRAHNFAMLGVTVAGLAITTGVLLGPSSASWQSQTVPGYTKGNGQAYALNGPSPAGDGGGPSSSSQGGATNQATFPPVELPRSNGHIVRVSDGQVLAGFPFSRSTMVPTTFYVAPRGPRYVALYAGTSARSPQDGLVLVWISGINGIGSPSTRWLRFPHDGSVALMSVALAAGSATVLDGHGGTHSLSF
jgi:hypothetical protein